MIRTDGRPTIANAPVRPKKIPGQMTVDECIELARRERENDYDGQPMTWDEIEEAQPVYGGF